MMNQPRSANKRPIELDGRHLEGGGQLLRIALCLSALTGVPIRIHDIRGNRSRGGGLKAQHLACVNWLAHASRARVEGAVKGSKTLVFEPDSAAAGLSPAFKKVVEDGKACFACRLDIGTAGSTGLALQAILPFILFTKFPSDLPVRVTLSGGTNVSGSPSFEYITQVLLPTLREIGFPQITATLEKRGWSHGASSIGSFTLGIPPRRSVVLPAFKLRPEDVNAKPRRPLHFQATVIAPASCLDHFRNVLAQAVCDHFGDFYLIKNGSLDIICDDSQHEKRMYLIIVATMLGTTDTQTYKLGRDWLYDHRIHSHEQSANEMVKQVVNDLADEVESGGWVDEHMRDQLVIFQALAQGRSEVFAGRGRDGRRREPSLHARTAEWDAQRMQGVRFGVDGVCEGIGFGCRTAEDADVDGRDELADAVEKLDVR